ncbi:MAG: bifunctional transcriptional activator/DNA repair enzyme AdaA [bacterium]
MTDYERIAAAIHFIRDNATSQPSLGQIAAHLHLSPYHFQRLFKRWAGITPKQFLAHITEQNARELVRESGLSLESIADAVGLTSHSRLYDNTVTIEAVTPSELRSRGAGLTIRFGLCESPFGTTLIAATPRGLCKLAFVDSSSASTCLSGIKQTWPNADFIEDDKFAENNVQKIFASPPASKPSTDAAPFRLHLRGTNFQVHVWRALLEIPRGQLSTYGAIAAAIDHPAAHRAVGTAVGANPIAYLIPCHRVIRQDGNLGGYRWGPERKRVMQVWETI